MRLNRLTRKVHYWASILIAVPLLVVVSTGILLQLKKHTSWIQPHELQGTGIAPAMTFEDMLAAVAGISELEVEGWDDIKRIDVRPELGMAKVSLHNGWEVQVDIGTGEILQTAYRRSDLIESLHDGSYFAGDVSKLLIFLPSGVILLLMLASGLWLFLVPIVYRRRRARKRAVRASQAIPRL